MVTLRERILTLHQRLFSPAHPRTLTARGELADAYMAAGRPDQAIRALERNLALIEREHGPDAPMTQIARRDLEKARRPWTRS
ncbi:tetratricopeptide repeat protein [Actinomadura sp. DC4]|nr:tetratricopeptide repeat protein [Actinomadura sp. DC4]MDN3355487.1 tetratricopeptide repeat protein [Actinomadura sp. DC4]